MRQNPHRTALQRQRHGATYAPNPSGTGGYSRAFRRRGDSWKQFAAKMRALGRTAQARAAAQVKSPRRPPSQRRQRQLIKSLGAKEAAKVVKSW
jgi:hypothetical protein